MNARLVISFSLFMSIAAVGWSQNPGEACEPGTEGRPGITCQATDDWRLRLPYIQNAKKGDVIVSAGCGMIADLLKQVTPNQEFSHSGVMTLNYAEVRHSTAMEGRYIAHAGSDGFEQNILKYGWPGTITQPINEAYEGVFMADPLGDVYRVAGFNNVRNEDPDCQSVTVVFPTVIKPPITDEPTVRPRLENVAEQAKLINGHYRLYAYTDGAIVGKPEFRATIDSGWAFQDAPEGTVCSELAWSSARAAGVAVEDAMQETGDRQHPPNTNLAGLFVYTSTERAHAGEWLYDEIYNKFYEQAGAIGRLLTDAPDDGANQMANCFAFDWCGSEPGKEFDGEPDSKDSDRWRNPGPGVGVALAPDDILHWDAPPAGNYGQASHMVYRPGSYERLHQWARSQGTADVVVHATYLSNPLSNARVVLLGFPEMTTDAAGAAQFISIPGGRYAIEANKTVRENNVDIDVRFAGTVDVPSSGTQSVNVALSPDPAAFPTGTRWHRKVTVRGTVHITDHETIGSNENGDFAINQTVVLDPVGKPLHKFEFEFCTGDEVRVEGSVLVNLHAQDVSVLAELNGKLFEGSDCNTDDLEDEDNMHETVTEGGTKYFHMGLVNGDWDGDDHGDIQLTILNERNP